MTTKTQIEFLEKGLPHVAGPCGLLVLVDVPFQIDILAFYDVELRGCIPVASTDIRPSIVMFPKERPDWTTTYNKEHYTLAEEGLLLQRSSSDITKETPIDSCLVA